MPSYRSGSRLFLLLLHVLVRQCFSVVGAGAGAAASVATERMDGFNFLYGSWGSGDAVPDDAYNSTHAKVALASMKNQTDNNWIAFSYLWYQKNVDTAGPIYRRPDTPDNSALSSAIATAHALGLKVMVRPLVNADPKLKDPDGPHTWRGMIGRNFTASQWESWFASYQQMIWGAAELASQANADSLCVGGELIVASHQEKHWRSIIKGVRARFNGPIMYAANWGNEDDVQFWDAVDQIGVDAYYPLAKTKADPTVDQLVASWEPIKAGLRALSKKVDKPLIFAEVGYCSTAQSNEHPAQCGGPLSEKAQANLYEALLTSFYAKSESDWFRGIFWWDWSTTPTDGGATNGGFSPNRKLAAEVVRRFYSQRT